MTERKSNNFLECKADALPALTLVAAIEEIGDFRSRKKLGTDLCDLSPAEKNNKFYIFS
ncbi:MAG: hypothetical protein J7L25_01170 [Deltaproteobacteria bacterium]|nr:hypothetical protein [Candidatus Tharpella aukensis]